MAVNRRMGSIDSEKAEAMLDAAWDILRDEGYGALTSRRVAEYAGVKQRLVYYYFQTMDDLVLEAFKRSARRDLKRLRAGIASERPLHEVWDAAVNTTDSRIISEFMALANHHEGLRKEVIAFIEESRRIQIKALKKAMANNDEIDNTISPDAIAFIGTSVALALSRESLLGITMGHRSVQRLIKQFFDQLEA